MERLPVTEMLVKVRLATPEDLMVDDRTMNYGQVFWLRSMLTGEFQNQPMKITQHTDPKDIAEWLKFKMIYVPVRWSEAIEDPVEEV